MKTTIKTENCYLSVLQYSRNIKSIESCRRRLGMCVQRCFTIMSDTTKLSCTVYRKESQDYDIIKNFGTGKSKSTEQVKSMVFNNMRKKKGSLDVIINSLMNMRLLQMIIPDINGADFYLAI
ncbi:uncharacterized protein LOC143250531 isoform X3 [Tachypleus tridentatus]|uniref:uncharacterized protein LOC143250531 isoform X3 n=1 Tax=Tachypleus tridentatus TaxID=6853 RepID=UPI003FD348BC